MMKTFLRRHGWPMNHTQAKPSFYIPAKSRKVIVENTPSSTWEKNNYLLERKKGRYSQRLELLNT